MKEPILNWKIHIKVYIFCTTNEIAHCTAVIAQGLIELGGIEVHSNIECIENVKSNGLLKPKKNLEKIRKIADTKNVKIDFIGKTQSEIFEIENNLRISVKELKTNNESWFKNYNKN